MTARKIPQIGNKSAGGAMRIAVDLAVGEMTWLKPSDGAMVALARHYADEVDSAKLAEDSRAVGYLGQQLHAVLKALGGTPLDRKSLAQEGGGKKSGLTNLRAARADRERRAQAVDEASS